MGTEAAMERQVREEARETVAIFIDFSNLAIGAQLVNGRRDLAQRLSVENLTKAMVGTRTCERKVVAGSKPSSSGIWTRWKDAGYEVSVETRDAESGKETHVDAAIAGKALFHAVTQKGPRKTLVVGTGDGNLEGQVAGTAGANFRNLVQEAARLGWTVEVWSWRAQLHSCYYGLAASTDPELQGRVKIKFLDGLRFEDPIPGQFSITFRERWAPGPTTDGDSGARGSGSP